MFPELTHLHCSQHRFKLRVHSGMVHLHNGIKKKTRYKHPEKKGKKKETIKKTN